MAEKMGRYMYKCVILIALCLRTAISSQVLLISLDGFRWDYIDNTYTPNFDKFISKGVRVQQVTNAFATLTMPNHWTMVTGMYEEDHGIIANSFFDSKFNDTYRYSTDSKWYNNTEPIWITAEKEGKKSGAYMWVGNQAEYNGITASKVIPFRNDAEFSFGLDIAMEWLASDKLSLVCLYSDQPDKYGHTYGPNSDETKAKVREIDRSLGEILEKFDERDLTDKVNILIASDHGMTDVGGDRSINLGRYVNFTLDVEWSYISAIGLIIPKPGKMAKVYADLKIAEGTEGHMKVYKKEDIPEDLRYKNNSRIPEIVIVVESGWLLKKSGSYSIDLKGNHGFDNKGSDMKTTFLARGPDINCGYKQDSMRSVDVYPLLCKLLGLKTCHQSRGSLENTTNLISDSQCFPESVSAAVYATLTPLTICFSVLMSVSM